MCGIYLTNIPFEEGDIKERLNSIKYRGPDYTGVQKIDEISLAHLRLSILDIDVRSNQPMDYQNYVIAYNGEIYNFLEIKDELISFGYTFNTTSDTEVLLKGFHKWGEDVVSKLNGMFAFGIYDKTTKKLFCSRDRLGVKPFYYYWKDGEFEICSQLRPIKNRHSINNEAISIYLDCTYIPSPYTIYQDVFKLPPGCNLIIDLESKVFEIKEYWNLKPVVQTKKTYEEAKVELHELLKDAVKIRLKSDVPFGSFLSGGIDSAVVSSIASKVSDNKIKTFSIGFVDPKYDESKIAAEYAKILGTEHTETICKPEDFLEVLPRLIEVYDEPFADSSALPSLLLNKVTKEYVTMALSGDGGDESFIGYNHFDWITKVKTIIKIPAFIRILVSKLLIFPLLGKSTAGFKRVLGLKSRFNFIEGVFLGYNSLLLKRDFSWMSKFKSYKKWSNDILQQTADLNIKLWLENDSNVKVDRASMAYSVEVRSPFLDYRIVELARTFPIDYRYGNGIKKRIVRDILEEYIPEKIFNQPKKGFSIPIGAWIRKELREEFEENLKDDFLKIVPNLNVPKFKKMFKEHLEGKNDNASYIWRVYVLSKWYQEFGFYKTKA